jgi:hypothetical protein
LNRWSNQTEASVAGNSQVAEFFRVLPD